jgi:hypothetical protein
MRGRSRSPDEPSLANPREAAARPGQHGDVTIKGNLQPLARDRRMQILPAYMMRSGEARSVAMALDLAKDGTHMRHHLRARCTSHNVFSSCQNICELLLRVQFVGRERMLRDERHRENRAVSKKSRDSASSLSGVGDQEGHGMPFDRRDIQQPVASLREAKVCAFCSALPVHRR